MSRHVIHKRARLRRVFWDDIQSGFGLRRLGTMRRLYLWRLVVEWIPAHSEVWWDGDKEYFDHVNR